MYRDKGKTIRIRLTLGMLLIVACISACKDAHDTPTQPITAKPAFDWMEYSGTDAIFEDALPPGAYQNPILTGYHPDPSVQRVGEDFYLVNSTFGFYPGIPLFHSRDLVNWIQLGNVIDRPDMMPFDSNVSLTQSGIYAPTIRYHDGVFYVITTCVGCGGNFIVTASDPAGPWSDPIWLPHIDGIDPSLLFDDDGRVYIVHLTDPKTKRYPAHTALAVMEVDAQTFAPKSEDVIVVDGGDKQPSQAWNTDYIEGPHLYKIDGRYYLSAAGGGTGYFHQQLMYRSKQPFGPFEANPHNPILTQFGLPDDRPDPVTATGHADLFQDTSGHWWAVFLGTRVYDLATPPQDPGNFHTGRETFLLPVTWQDDWPVILEQGVTLPYRPPAPRLPASTKRAVPTTGNFTWHEAFDTSTLAPQWLFARTPRSQWWEIENGQLILEPRSARIGANAQPSFIGRRIQHMTASIVTRMRFTPKPGEEAGLLAVQNDGHYYAFGLTLNAANQTVLRVRKREGDEQPADGIVIAEHVLNQPTHDGITLKVDIDKSNIHFAFSQRDNAFTTVLADADARLLTSAVAGGFTGAVIGPFAQRADTR